MEVDGSSCSSDDIPILFSSFYFKIIIMKFWAHFFNN